MPALSHQLLDKENQLLEADKLCKLPDNSFINLKTKKLPENSKYFVPFFIWVIPGSEIV